MPFAYDEIYNDFEHAKEHVGKGWESIVKEAFDERDKNYSHIHFVQIKEKFGGIRLYADSGKGFSESDRPYYDFLYKLEEKSFQICEECGATENVSTSEKHINGFWIKTLCKDCRDNFNRETKD